MKLKTVNFLFDKYSNLFKFDVKLSTGVSKSFSPETGQLKLKDGFKLSNLISDVFEHTPGRIQASAAKEYKKPLICLIIDELNIPKQARLNIAKHTSKLHNMIVENSSGVAKLLENTFKSIEDSVFESRVKSLNNLHQKVYRKIKNAVDNIKEYENLLKTECSVDIRESHKKSIHDLDKRRRGLLNDFNTIRNELNDALGTRLILRKPTRENTDKIVQKLIDGINNGDFKITEIESYATDAEHFYFSQSQIDKIVKACEKKNLTVNLKVGYKPSGYTTTQFKLIFKNDIRSELQVRGNEVHTVAQGEHLLYDFREGKNIAKSNKAIAKILEPLYNALQNIDSNPKLEESYERYIHDFYKYKRDIEMLIPAYKPALPNGIPKILGMDNIIKVNENIEKIKVKSKRKVSL